MFIPEPWNPGEDDQPSDTQVLAYCLLGAVAWVGFIVAAILWK